ncbi:Alpha/Beta hydrolase protein [Hygrophoropsis aurantiaca]|uniref:Alpha/Beta hydrolase protein n=1 Tax=Hygrophoropsis aurantiaca TaxID=72124 RepID=A0ACB8A7R4_9AGAM|nr:Alpha/Beta hydrolase protein [Hygrophoropsis aurantiaca]
MAAVEGEANFDVPAAGKPCKTWYKVYGDLTSRTHRPLVVLHGGPGSTHHYVSTLSELYRLYSIPVILYDQLGNGLSTHLPEKNGDTAFWTVQLFIDELHNLLTHLGIHDDYALLGQSWGGMLAACFAVQQPVGLKKLVIANSPASMPLWVEVANELKRELPQAVQDTLNKHEAAGTILEKEYRDATQVFYDRHLCRIQPMPKPLADSFEWMDKDPTVYLTMNGPTEFHIIGSLKAWSVIDDLHKIQVSTLLLNGRYDEAQDKVVLPFFQRIPSAKWVQFSESAHVPHIEETERYMTIVGAYLNDN